MKRQLYENLYKTEDKYWWFVGQRYLLGNFLRKKYGNKKLQLLDVGCGTGRTLQMLKRFGKACGIDISNDSLDFCKMKKVGNVKKSNVLDIKLKKNTFDVVTSLGVFYHKAVTDDVKGMKEINRVLKPGGRLFFLDCAMMCLYGKHDIAFQGKRRYSVRELRSKLRKAGFIVEKISYINTTLFPFVYIYRKLSKLSKAPPKSEVDESINPLINGILKALYKFELWLVQYVSFPFGVNIVAIARKK